MRRLTVALLRTLDVLLALSVLVLVFPVSLQIFSRFTDLLPQLHLDRGDGPPALRLDGDDRLDARGT